MRLQKELDAAQTKTSEIQMQLQMTEMQVKVQESVIRNLQLQLSRPHQLQQLAAPSRSNHQRYKLYLEKNIEICNLPGCRVMEFGPVKRMLVASSKSIVNMFNGFGVRNIDLVTFKPTNYLHISQSPIRDIAFDKNEEVLVAATGEKTVRLFSIDNRTQIDSFTPSDSATIWSASFDATKQKLLYLGSHNGAIYSYDIRNTRSYLKEYRTFSDCSPVVSIRSVPPSDRIPFGGFLVCKLVSCFFFEYTGENGDEVNPTKLNIDGPFMSMNFDPPSNRILVSSRPNDTHPQARHTLGELVKLNNDMFAMQPINTFFGSKQQSQLSRSCQVSINDDVVVVAYNEEAKALQTYSVNLGERMQSLAMEDKILDVCSMHINNETYMAGLTEKRCRILRFSSGSDPAT